MLSIKLNCGSEFQAEPGISILDAAAKAQISLPYSCKTGRCSACRCKVIRGKTRIINAEFGLSDDEKAAGWILSCARSAETNLVLDADHLGGVELPAVKTLPCRIHRLEKLSPDVIQVLLRLPPTADFKFIPGQYVDILGPGSIRRSYSLANANFVDKLLELHIRAVEGGAMSRYWFGQAKVNDLLRMNGPLGTFFLRDTANIDLILLATGTGIAPVKAMLESMSNLPATQGPKSVTVLWGGRNPQDLYLDIASISDRHNFVPVLSRTADGWTGAKGYVQQVLLELDPDLENATIYACGSDSMIHSARELLIQAGLPPKRFYSDAFVCSGTN